MSAKATTYDAELDANPTGCAVIQSENGFGDVTNTYLLADEAVVGVEVWIPDEDVSVGVESELV